MKIAKFQRIGRPDWTAVFEGHADGTDQLIDTFVRISEYVDVQFPPRPPEEVVPAQIAALDAKEKELRGEFLAKLNDIAEQRARLKALTHEVQS